MTMPAEILAAADAIEREVRARKAVFIGLAGIPAARPGVHDTDCSSAKNLRRV